MAIRSDAKSFLLPFPGNIRMHDEWIGLCSSIAGRVNFVGQQLIDYRRHENNVTQLVRGPLPSMVRKRLDFLFSVLGRLPRILIWRFRRHD
jgi:hypothetical protein